MHVHVCDFDNAVDLVEVVHSDGCVEVLVVVEDSEEAVDAAKTTMKSYLLMTLMLIWTSIMPKHQKQCRRVKDVSRSSPDCFFYDQFVLEEKGYKQLCFINLQVPQYLENKKHY